MSVNELYTKVSLLFTWNRRAPAGAAPARTPSLTSPLDAQDSPALNSEDDLCYTRHTNQTSRCLFRF